MENEGKVIRRNTSEFNILGFISNTFYEKNIRLFLKNPDT